MPVYEYHCDNCRREITVTLPIREHDKSVPALPAMWWSRPPAVGEYVLLADVPEVLVHTEQGQRVTWASEFFLGVSGVLRGHLYLASRR